MTENYFEQALAELERRELKLAIAESLTGGLLSSNFVSVAGASKVLLGSIVAYQNEIKTDLLSVPANLLAARGAANAEVALAMAEGVRERLAHSTGLAQDRVVALSTTGVAGPGPDGSVSAGTVFVGLTAPGEKPLVEEFHFEGDRAQVREQTCAAAVKMLRDYLNH